MSRKGRMIWGNRRLIEELESIKTAEGLKSNSESMNKMAEHSKIGREVEKWRNQMFPPRRNKKKGRR